MTDETTPAGPAPDAAPPKPASAKAANKRSQEPFLNDLRKRKQQVEVYLMSGVRLIGTIESFDAQTVLLKANGMTELVNKQLISTVCPSRRPERSRAAPRQRDPDDVRMAPRKPRPAPSAPGPTGEGSGSSQPSQPSGPRVSYRAKRTLSRDS